MNLNIFLSIESFVNSDFFYGFIGFIGFEAVRVYKVTTTGNAKSFYNHGPIAVAIVLLLISLFSGVVAEIFNSANQAKSLFIGFSVPSGLNTLFGKSFKGSGTQIDETMTRKINQLQLIGNAFKKYFLF